MRKRSKNPTSRALRAAKRAAAITSEKGEISPIDYLFDLMNDERLSRMQQGAIAKKLAPYFHPKLKQIPPDQLHGRFARNDPTDNGDAESEAHQRERIRKWIFGRFD